MIVSFYYHKLSGTENKTFLLHFLVCLKLSLILSLLENVIPWLCRSPSITTYRVNLQKTSTDKFKKHVEYILKQRYEVPPNVFSLPDIPEVVCIAQCPETTFHHGTIGEQKEVIVDCCCGGAILRGAHIYSIGVLGMESGTKVGDLVNVFADLAGKCKKGLNVRYESNQKIYLGQGKVLMQRYQLYRNEGPIPGIAVEMLSTISGVPSIGDLSSPEALLQNLPSIVCSRALDPQKGEIILDMCSAPGNKTGHIAQLMQDQGVLVALDKTESKIALVKQMAQRNGVTCVKAHSFDSTNAYSECIEENSVDFKPPFKAESFDRILLDAPCSALGIRPMLANTISPKMLKSYPNVQKKLFSNAVKLLRKGGTLIYSTCTVNISENEEIVAWALSKFPELNLEQTTPLYGGPGWPCNGLIESDRLKLQRFGPNDEKTEPKLIDTVGFFIAKFVKRL
ncbi:tRNA (cytosine(72)-C(5))-methyltransferase NSUN6 isoform X2 [Haematobia irritans]|uniref:tRNA (cytosine(72)-C(5))-methyltransferase NSUN6 isoform X2 n=1 Tax=Haematobia irritans TaxID=7368 RepID=UPI003F50864E